MRKLLRNKKGSLSAAINGLFSMIGHFFSTLPPLAKIMIFLLFLSLFGFIISILFTILGYHCDTQDNLYTVPWFNVLKNIDLVFDRPTSDEINSAEMDTETVPLLGKSCVVINASGEAFYDGRLCTDCTLTGVKPFGESTHKRCAGDVYRKSRDEQTWIQRKLCGDGFLMFGCEPPLGYFYNWTTETYHCHNLAVCGNVTVGTRWDMTLSDEATLVIPLGDESRSYKRAFSVGCNTLAPTFKFYGIPLLDYRLWIILTFITFMASGITTLMNLE